MTVTSMKWVFLRCMDHGDPTVDFVSFSVSGALFETCCGV